jgi:predicted aldo/keto reductase-like oxidoreductase
LRRKMMENSRKKSAGMSRRNFLAATCTGLLTARLPKAAALQESASTKAARIEAFRMLGRTGFKASDIGCGTPINEGLVRRLIESGVNVFDTSEIYYRGQSERTLGRVLKEFDRKSFFVMTKVFPPYESEQDVYSRATKSLERLDMSYVDGLILQNAESVEIVTNRAFHAALARLKNEGKVRYGGLACHGTAWSGKPKNTLEEILMTGVGDGRFDVVLLAYNFLHQEMSRKVLGACRERNIGTVIIKSNPVSKYSQLAQMAEQIEKGSVPEGGGTLEEYKEYLPWIKDTLIPLMKEQSGRVRDYTRDKGIVSEDAFMRDVAIRFILSNPDVGTVLYTFENFGDIESVLGASGKTLEAAGRPLIDEYQRGLGRLYCRPGCAVCEDSCPHGLPINTIMRYNHYRMAQGREDYAAEMYADLPGLNARVCQSCEGYCGPACPHQVPVPMLLRLAHRNLALG